MFPTTASVTATSDSNPSVFGSPTWSGFGQPPLSSKTTFATDSHGFRSSFGFPSGIGMSNSHGTSSSSTWTTFNPPLSNQTTFAATSTSTSPSGGGIRIAAYKKTADKASSAEKLESISAMPIYHAKSHEELRWEDYNITRKGGFGLSCSSVPSTKSSVNNISFEPTTKTPAWNYPGPTTTWSTSQPLESSSAANTCFTTPSNSFNPFLPKTTLTSTTVSTPNVNSFNPFLPKTTLASTTVSTPPVNSFNTFLPRTTPTSTTVSAPNLNSFNQFLPKTTVTYTTVSVPHVNSFNSFLPGTTLASATVSTPPVNSFNTFLPRTTPTSTTVSAPNVNSFNSILPSFPLPTLIDTPLPTNAFWSTPVTEPSISMVISSAKSVPVSPEIPGLNSTYNQPTTLVNPFAPSTQNCSTGTIGQSSASQPSSSQITSVEQPSSAASPFGTLPPRPQMISQSTQPIQYGISSIPVKDKPAPVRLPLLTTRHVSSRSKLPLRKYDPKLNGPKIPFFNDTMEIPVDVFVPRGNPRALVLSPEMWQQRAIIEKLPGNVYENEIDEDPTKDEELPKTILDIPIKHPQADYYTQPLISELEAKERADPGFCKHVKDFVVGRHGYGSIKFLGETDVRNLDLESHVQFNNREVIVYMDDTKKPPVGEGLNKPAEITLLNIKCFDKKTGMQYMDGSKIDKYTQRLKKKAVAQGVDFMSYDPIEGEWKFRVQHF